jgi:hypothetical protein
VESSDKGGQSGILRIRVRKSASIVCFVERCASSPFKMLYKSRAMIGDRQVLAIPCYSLSIWEIHKVSSEGQRSHRPVIGRRCSGSGRNSKGRRLTTVQVFIMRLQSPRNTVNSRAGAPSLPPLSGCSDVRRLVKLPTQRWPAAHPAASLDTIDYRVG